MKKKGGYGVVYQDVTRNSNISVAAKGLYAYLASYCGNSSECYPSIDTITKELGITKDTFYKHISVLVAVGIVEKKQEIHNGRFGRTIYKLTHEVKILDFSFPKKSASEDSESNNNITNNNNINSKNNTTSPKKSAKSYFPDNESLNQAFTDYVEMRKQIKKPMTDRAVELAMKKLKELSTLPFSDSMDNELAIQILNQSIMNGWQGLFPLKEQKANYQYKKGGGKGGENNQSRGQAADFYEQLLGTGNGD